MKAIRIVLLLLFALIIVVPLILFNTAPNQISEIDNRTLTENPFTLAGDLTVNIQNYVNDRIGLRDEMITAYTVMNDMLFGKMVHPSYVYGKDGHVFGSGITTQNMFGDYHIVFADMVAKIQNYCTERGVPFLFVFNPAKPAVYTDMIASGVNYDREWVNLFFAELDRRGVNYLDNTETLVELRASGVDGFNQKYDANHWNDVGAFYGTQAMLVRLNQLDSNVHINRIEEFSCETTRQTSLMVSRFPINELVPTHRLLVPTTSRYNEYFHELKLHPSYKGFGYYVNSSEEVKSTPKTLVFQGSYMNSYGSKYMRNAFREYIHVHDYQNVLDFPYYFNIFQPECVVFEVAEYTVLDKYFSYERMKEINYTPALETLRQEDYNSVDVTDEKFTVDAGETLTTIIWHTDQVYPHVWLFLDSACDMQRVESGYQVTVETKRYELWKDSFKVYVSKP